MVFLLLVLFSLEQRTVAPLGDLLHVHGDVHLVDDLLADQALPFDRGLTAGSHLEGCCSQSTLLWL
jgi:hypothetical protein